MKIKIDIFSGFLGAGKTMLIKKLLKEAFQNEKIALIENEFGEVGIDGAILKKSNIDIKEINAGCICCSVASDFESSIKEVISKYKPQRIIIEPSGVGKLSEVLNVCKNEDIKKIAEINSIITVVDSTKAEIYIKNFSEFYKNQIQNARTLMLSRTQNLSNENIISVCKKLKMLNDKARIITTPWDQITGEKILSIIEEVDNNIILEQVNLLKKPAITTNVKMKANHTAGEVFQTVGIETPKIFKKMSISKVLRELETNSNLGVVLRAKGIVETETGWIQFDYVPQEFEMRDTAPEYNGRICIIGSNLNKEKIKKLFL